MIIVGRHVNGITINPLEILLDGDGNEMQFENILKAEEYLKEHGLTDDDIYWLTFKEVHNYLKVGEYIPATDESEAVIDREYHRQGYIVKDEEAYETSLEKVCYVPELSDATYTHQSFLDMCDGQEEIARSLFDRVDWQHPETLFEEDYANGEYDNCLECGKLFASYEVTECPHCHALYNNEEI